MQSMLLLFLPLPSLLFEVYPYKYFKQAYSPLAREYGVRHGNVMSPPFSRWNAVLLHGEERGEMREERGESQSVSQ